MSSVTSDLYSEKEPLFKKNDNKTNRGYEDDEQYQNEPSSSKYLKSGVLISICILIIIFVLLIILNKDNIDVLFWVSIGAIISLVGLGVLFYFKL